MNYLLDKRTRRKKYWVRSLAIVSLGLLIFFRGPIFRGLSFSFSGVFYPVIKGGALVGDKFENFFAYFVSKRSLDNENDELRRKVLEAEARMLNYGVLKLENDELKATLGRKPIGKNVILAAILAKPNQSAYDTLVIDVDGEHKVAAGDMVYALGDVPIGRVSAVNPGSSTVVLFSSPGERTPAVLSGSASSLFYELVGRGGGNFEMILPRETTLTPGDSAVLPGVHPFVVAQVAKIISDARDPFTKALLISPVNIQNLKFVEVEVNK